jgi:hypothetical protein
MKRSVLSVSFAMVCAFALLMAVALATLGGCQTAPNPQPSTVYAPGPTTGPASPLQQQQELAAKIDLVTAAVVQTGQVVAGAKQALADTNTLLKTPEGQKALIDAATPPAAAAAGLAGGPGWGAIVGSVGGALSAWLATYQLMKKKPAATTTSTGP